MAGYVVEGDDDRVRKRRTARDPSPHGRGIPIPGTAEPNTKQNCTNARNGAANEFYHKIKKHHSRRRSSPSSLMSRWIMNLRKTRSPAFIGLAVVVSGIILAAALIAAITSVFSSSNECIESHINGISGNIYSWCYKHKNGIIQSMTSRYLSEQMGDVERVIVLDNHAPRSPKDVIKAINSHEHFSQEIVASDQDEICYADMAKLGDRLNDHASYHQPVIGPCHYDYPLTKKPLSGSYEEVIDFFFFRDSENSKWTDKLKCLNECVDRALTKRQKHATIGKHHGHRDPTQKERKVPHQQESDERALNEIEAKDRVPVDDTMLIEAARAGMTFVAEKLFLKYGLDPLYRQVKNDPSSSRNLNAIQEAIRGGYAEIVAILTAGDNSMVIDEYGRTVIDYVKLSGSPIRPIDAKNVLGIHVEEGGHKRPAEKQRAHHNSGWSETAADPYDKERCDFDIVDGDLDPKVFYRDYFMTGRPVVLRGQTPQIELDMFTKKRWSQTEKFHPDQTFKVGPTAYPKLSNQELCKNDMSINEMEQGKLCEEMPEKPMVHAFHPLVADFKALYPDFRGDVLDERGGFRSVKQFFSLVETRTDLVWQVFFGGDGSGATYHWHEAAFNILYVGVKEWKIGPPLYRGTTGMTARQVAATLDPKISLTCVQQPGDMFYIPNYWGHSTYNHGFTIGAAAIVEDWFQNGGASYRGEKEEEEEEISIEVEEEEEGNPSFLFVHINKTGGTSLIKMFAERCEEEYWGDPWYDSEGRFHRPFHATAHAYIEEYGKEAWDKAYTFTVVRHPLARQVSNFFFLVSMGCEKLNNKCEERFIPTLDLNSMSDEEKIEAFHKWILKLYKAFPPGSPEHYRFGAAGHGNEVYHTFGASQTSWNVDANGNMVVKDFYKLEELSKDITSLADKIPCLKNGPLDMAKENKTSKYPHFMLFAKDEQTKKIIKEVFADDFKNFGYDPL
mmetsp:Transcript_1023/g.2367  ORF Transcript_1023/g.2367 Transcript_1023/m.2367 type:complete len:956 (-) Transcript_1023:134-3001(-)|eukprot:CAMPEP_0168176364 /NCGR_PEP_ID=MMETSP0139_2-20121125/7739_1 /TAXON_ID=44445 /ORGANISM="Pseudo-nitzschia australis, Strain 10249 10 AB" /LENGTH=955 /DNA_ID=CAMNT_0008095059 /DNA_START=201 /DNA_END=3068 /DNA_ORIENTATION=-